MAELDYQYLATLVNRTKMGDSDAFAELYASTYKKQYRFAYHYLRDEFLAQDALQEVYILVLKNIDKLRDPKVFISWLNQITFRVCFNMAKKQSRYDTELHDYDTDTLPGSGHHSKNPELQASEQDTSDYILKKILELPLLEAQIVLMHYYRDMKIDAIAIALDISRSTVKRKLASGKKQLEHTLNL